jgi:hypothetical protein
MLLGTEAEESPPAKNPNKNPNPNTEREVYWEAVNNVKPFKERIERRKHNALWRGRIISHIIHD